MTEKEARRVGAIGLVPLFSLCNYFFTHTHSPFYEFLWFMGMLAAVPVGGLAGAVLAGFINRKWLLPAKEIPNEAEPTSLYIWTLRSFGMLTIACSLALVVYFVEYQSLRLGSPDYVLACMTFLFGIGVMFIGFESRSLLFFLITVSMVFYDLVCFSLSLDWTLFGVALASAIPTLGCLLIRRLARSQHSERHIGGPLTAQT